MLSLLLCPDPDCGVPAEVLDRVVLRSTSGPIEHAKVQCIRRHIFVMPIPAGEVAMIRNPNPTVAANIGSGPGSGPGIARPDTRRH
jgi:hypothetical protein